MSDQNENSGAASNHSTPQNKAANAPKDKACPFCNQAFTSSSLGRHLDLYIKEKNPKPADGVHHVDEIRKLRGNITRRQPRNSTKRQNSTPTTPNDIPRHGPYGSPGASAPGRGDHGAALRAFSLPDAIARPFSSYNAPAGPGTSSWQNTGVINNIPSASRNGELAGLGNGEADAPGELVDTDMNGSAAARTATGTRSGGHPDRARAVSRQTLAKTNFENKQKLTDALDSARAAELALREVLGSLRAASECARPSSTPFPDYDPLTLDFPTLTLRCLPPPPTLPTSPSPIPSENSWSLTPPSHPQLAALQAHFRDEFNNWRLAKMTQRQTRWEYDFDLHSAAHPDEEAVSVLIEKMQELEQKLDTHLTATFTHWNSLPPPIQSSIWILSLARAIATKDSALKHSKEREELLAQENDHLRVQLEELRRYQAPREFSMTEPLTWVIPKETRMAMVRRGIGDYDLGKGRLPVSNLVGLTVNDKEEDLPSVTKQVIGRWKDVIRKHRTQSQGMEAQRPLDGFAAPPPQNQNPIQQQETPPAVREGGMDVDEPDQDAQGESETPVRSPQVPRSEIQSGGRSVQGQQGRAAPVAMMGGGGALREMQQQQQQPLGEPRNGNGDGRLLSGIAEYAQHSGGAKYTHGDSETAQTW